MRTVDAVVIGAGHQGLITAAYLARAGWEVLVAERNDDVGGATRSGEATSPGLVHDLFATNINLFLASPAYADLKDDLTRHGFEPVVSQRSYSNVFPDGQSRLVWSDTERTEAGIGKHSDRDLQGWRDLHSRYQTFMQTLMPLYSTPLPSVQAALGAAKAVRTGGLTQTLDLLRTLTASTRELGDTWFETPEMKALIATWGMHLDYGPDVSGGAMFPFLETFTDMQEGIAVTKGGISRLPEALAAIVREAGSEVRTSAPVTRVLTDGDRVTGVELGDGEQIGVRRAVVAGTTPTQLFGSLLADDAVDDRTRTSAERYRYGPGTMVVHLALDKPLQWSADDELSQFAYVHVAPYVDDLARTYQQSLAGLIPDSPLLIVGQTSQVDPSRSPDDRQVVWVQVRALPSQIRGDAAGEISATHWDEAKDAVADRVLDKLEQYAPGARGSVLDRAVLSPLDLERSNPNLVGGDSVAGSHHLWQNFIFRPWLGASTYDMPLEGLYLVGAATWPGGGTNGVSGSLCAQKLLSPHPYRKGVAGSVAGAAGLAAAAGALAARRR